MHWHIDTDIVSLIVIVAMYVYNVSMPSRFEHNMFSRRFTWCLQVGIIVSVIDIAASVVMEVPTSNLLYHILMSLYYISIELVIIAWFLYAAIILFHDDAKTRIAVTKVVLMPYLAYVLLVITNPWTGIMYSLSESGEYSRGPCFYLMIVVYTVYCLALLTLVFARRKHIPQGYSCMVLVAMPVILTASIVIQLSFSGLLTILPGYMICLVLAFLFLQNRRTRDSQVMMQRLSKAALTDQLTGLLNRAGMEDRVHKSLETDIGKRCVVIVADIDGLKRINDSMGHQEGDRAICGVADRLKAHFSSEDAVARFGGDEFVVYLVNEYSDFQLHRSLKLLYEEMLNVVVGEDNNVPVRGSIGVADGTVGSDDFEQLCIKADTAQYFVKHHGKNGFAFYTPEMDEEIKVLRGDNIKQRAGEWVNNQ